MTYVLYLIAGMGFGYALGRWHLRRDLVGTGERVLQHLKCPECNEDLTVKVKWTIK